MIAKVKCISHTKAAINYANDLKKGAKIISTHLLLGNKVQEFHKDFKLVQSLNANCTKNTISVILSFSPNNKKPINTEDLLKALKEFIKRMHLGDHQHVAIRHADKPHTHIHLYINRIDFKGKAYKDSRIGKKAGDIAHDLSRELGWISAKDVANAKHIGTKPIRKKIFQIQEKIIRDYNPKSILEYCKLLAKQNIKVHPVLGKNSKLRGFRFDYEGHTFKASEINRSIALNKFLVKFYPSLALSEIKMVLDIPITNYVNQNIVETLDNELSKAFHLMSSNREHVTTNTVIHHSLIKGKQVQNPQSIIDDKIVGKLNKTNIIKEFDAAALSLNEKLLKQNGTFRLINYFNSLHKAKYMIEMNDRNKISEIIFSKSYSEVGKMRFTDSISNICGKLYPLIPKTHIEKIINNYHGLERQPYQNMIKRIDTELNPNENLNIDEFDLLRPSDHFDEVREELLRIVTSTVHEIHRIRQLKKFEILSEALEKQEVQITQVKNSLGVVVDISLKFKGQVFNEIPIKGHLNIFNWIKSLIFNKNSKSTKNTTERDDQNQKLCQTPNISGGDKLKALTDQGESVMAKMYSQSTSSSANHSDSSGEEHFPKKKKKKKRANRLG